MACQSWAEYLNGLPKVKIDKAQLKIFVANIKFIKTDLSLQFLVL